MDNGAIHPEEHNRPAQWPLLTIGYGSQRSTEEFLELLHEYGVKYLIDVRTKPYSRFRPEFSRESLRSIMQQHGLVYHFMGDSLGGLPSDTSCYTEGRVDYDKVRERDWFTRGLDRLQSGWKDGHRIAIMCAELEPHRCHRSKLIGEALIARNVSVGHIDEDGAVIAHDAAMARVDGGQLALFKTGHTSRRSYQPTAEDRT